MTNRDLLDAAMRQSAIDSGCEPEDFCSEANKVVVSRQDPQARAYLELPFDCDLTSYGGNIVASVSQALVESVGDYINSYSVAHCFETPNLHVLMARLKPFDLNICFMAEYFLPDLQALKPLSCGYETRLLGPEDFAELYVPNWSNALCEKRRHLDKLAVGAFDRGELIGLAGCSEDCGSMWQIGVDVLKSHRRQGVAACLTSLLALEVLKRGKVPFYCCAWSNILSARNAIASGFRPAWVQVTAKSSAFIADMNRIEPK